MSGPSPVRSGPSSEDFSMVWYGSPATLLYGVFLTFNDNFLLVRPDENEWRKLINDEVVCKNNKYNFQVQGTEDSRPRGSFFTQVDHLFLANCSSKQAINLAHLSTLKS